MQEMIESIPQGNELQTPAAPNQQSLGSGLDLQKLRKLRKGLRLTQADAATLLGIHRTYFLLIEKGQKVPSVRLQQAIVEFMQKAEQQPPQSAWDRPRPSRPAISVDPVVRFVPVLAWSTAAKALSFGDLTSQTQERIETTCHDPNAFAIVIEGDSMESKFLAGDNIVFTPGCEPRNGDVVFAKLKDSRALVRYCFRCGPEGTRIKLVSENPNYSPIEVDRSEVAFVFPASELKRQLRD